MYNHVASAITTAAAASANDAIVSKIVAQQESCYTRESVHKVVRRACTCAPFNLSLVSVCAIDISNTSLFLPFRLTCVYTCARVCMPPRTTTYDIDIDTLQYMCKYLLPLRVYTRAHASVFAPHSLTARCRFLFPNAPMRRRALTVRGG